MITLQIPDDLGFMTRSSNLGFEPTPDHLERLRALFHRSSMSKTFGMSMHYDEQSRAVFSWPYDARFDHFLDDTHGCVLGALVDNAGWFAAASVYPGWVVTAEFNVRLLEAGQKQNLRAIGSVVRRGRRLAVAEVRVERADGCLIATGGGTFATTGRSHPPPDGGGDGSTRAS